MRRSAVPSPGCCWAPNRWADQATSAASLRCCESIPWAVRPRRRPAPRVFPAAKCPCPTAPTTCCSPVDRQAMQKQHRLNATSLRALVLAATVSVLAACGGGGSPSGMYGSDSRYAATLLVSDQAGAAQLDAQLSDPWDLALGGGSALWVTNHGAASSAMFKASDLSLPALVIAAPLNSAGSARPTGVAFNPANGFEVTLDGRTGVARFIVSSDGGTLSGWAPSLGLDRTVVAFDGTATGAVYTGLAMTPQGVESVLLAVDFHNRVVDTFAADFTKLPADARFVDPELPAGYAPFGVAVQGDLIYITYASPDASARAPRTG